MENVEFIKKRIEDEIESVEESIVSYLRDNQKELAYYFDAQLNAYKKVLNLIKIGKLSL